MTMTKKTTQPNSPPVAPTTQKQRGGITGKGFMPGQSGNPAGRAPGSKNLTTAVREALLAIHEGTAKTYQELLVDRILKSAIDGDTAMVKLLWEQLDGKAAQKIIGTLTGVVATTKSVSTERAKKLIHEFNEALRADLNSHADDDEE